MISNKTPINSHFSQLSYDFEVKEKVDDLEIIINYNGVGSFKINKIQIEQNRNSYWKTITILLAFFMIMDFLYTFRKVILTKRKTIFFIFGIIFLSCLPLCVKGLDRGDGQDYGFHLMRIEGIAEGLRQGDFPVKLSSIWCDGYGYPVSIYYGDLLLYIPALLRIIGFSVISSFKFFVFLLNAVHVLVAYFCFKRIFKNNVTIGLLCAAAYSLSTYRLVDLYVRSAVGEYSAMIFFPILALALVNIYGSNETEWQYCKKNSIMLTLGLTGLIQTHVLSLEMTCFLLIIVGLVFWKKTFKITTIRVIMKSFIETLMVNIWFLIPFLDYYKNVSVRITQNVSSTQIEAIQDRGAYLAQFFAPFQTIFGDSGVEVSERLCMTPGMLLIGVLCVAVYCVVMHFNKMSKKSVSYLAFSLATIILSTNLFPWNKIATLPGVGKIFTVIQFPWRFIAFSTLFLTLLLGQMLVDFFDDYLKYCRLIVLGSIIILTFSTIYFTSDYINHMSEDYCLTGAELDHFRMTTGYMRYGTKKGQFTYDINSEQLECATIVEEKGNYMKIYCKSLENGGTLTIPKLNYKGYVALDDLGNKLAIQDSENNEIQIVLQSQYDGYITVEFQELWYWRVAEIVALTYISGILMWNIYKKFVRKIVHF